MQWKLTEQAGILLPSCFLRFFFKETACSRRDLLGLLHSAYYIKYLKAVSRVIWGELIHLIWGQSCTCSFKTTAGSEIWEWSSYGIPEITHPDILPMTDTNPQTSRHLQFLLFMEAQWLHMKWVLCSQSTAYCGLGEIIDIDIDISVSAERNQWG